ncbi:hypothetical protein [Clostridium hydrogenum]|uniref:hypothetical protein n=1 Tax=Clostridium hydrogenum TaxID=2855764 RepID=UPI001F185A5A|nr:hypothetical protein [Clostridium hydrogenum]
MLSLYERLNRGEVRNKQNLAVAYGVDEKTMQRDIRDLNNYLRSDDKKVSRIVVYNKS